MKIELQGRLLWVLLGTLLAGAPSARAQDASVPDANDSGLPCGSVDSLGQCQGNVLRVCTNGVLSETDCPAQFGSGFTCALVPPVQAAQCVYVPDDAGPPPPDAGDDDGGLSINPLKPTEDGGGSGCGCIKPAWGQSALWLSALWVMRPVRRRRG